MQKIDTSELPTATSPAMSSTSAVTPGGKASVGLFSDIWSSVNKRMNSLQSITGSIQLPVVSVSGVTATASTILSQTLSAGISPDAELEGFVDTLNQITTALGQTSRALESLLAVDRSKIYELSRSGYYMTQVSISKM